MSLENNKKQNKWFSLKQEQKEQLKTQNKNTIKQVNSTILQSHCKFQYLNWKYGNIIFTQKIQSHEKIIQLINHVNNQNQKNSKQNTFLITTTPFQNLLQSSCLPTLLIQSSQKNKSFQTLQTILSFLLQNKANRNSHLIIQGGGMLMDIANLAASIYMRGIKNVTLIPTTLLGMVDATIGGKTAINFLNAKNIIGSTRNPQNIFICSQYLMTQTKRQFHNGLVQSIKMAITYDRQFFQFLQNVNYQTLRESQNLPILQKIIKKSLQIKLKVVEKDLTQKNQRKWLNFGHTIGHAIQLDENNKLLHGQCIAIGMIKAIELSIIKGIIEKSTGTNLLQRIIKLIKKLEISTNISSDIDTNKMIQRMLKDKKKSNSQNKSIDFVLIEDIGKRCIKTTIIQVSELKQFFSNAVQISYNQNQIKPINDIFNFPSSKSISLRYLYLSCLAYLKNLKNNPTQNKQITLRNFLSSQDTQRMIYSLKQLGFVFQINEKKRILKIKQFHQKQKGQLDVGNSGITTRFILPLCFMLKGKWKINCHKRMEQRPNEQIFRLCQQNFQGKILYKKKTNCFPVQIYSQGKPKQTVKLEVQGKQSSQFISSAMINWSFINNQSTQIVFKSSSKQFSNKQQIVSESYINMTSKCLQFFGINAKLNKKNRRIQIQSKGFNMPQQIEIQKDLSTFSYPYIFYQLHDFLNQKDQINEKNYMQGDVLFYKYAKDLKQRLAANTSLSSISQNELVQLENNDTLVYDFNNCTDTFMTFAVYFCKNEIMNNSKNIKKITIKNIQNQRVKQSNRIHLTIKNLNKIGIKVSQFQKHITIHLNNKLQIPQNQTIIFQTNQDHRLAMSFGILSTYLSKFYKTNKFIIDSKKAVQKTFPEFWQYLKQTNVKLNFISVQEIANKKQLNFAKQNVKYEKKSKLNNQIVKNSIIFIGNRGSGKTTIGQNVARNKQFGFLDLDQLIKQQIKQNYKLQNISQFVDKYGWDQFRQLESNMLQNTLSSLRFGSNKPYVFSTGGGILDKDINKYSFERENSNIFYLERPFNQLNYQKTSHRPGLPNFEEISKKRQKTYQNYTSQIITFPEWKQREIQAKFAIDSIEKFLSKQKALKQGYIICLGDDLLIPLNEEQQKVSIFQIRIDKLIDLNKSVEQNMRQIRQKISQFRFKNMEKDIILTLRTKEQLGEFNQDQYLSESFNKINYKETMKKYISKIPCDFLDHQLSWK